MGDKEKTVEKEVKLRIRGVQQQGSDEEDNVEVISVGQMYEEGGFTCISYDEVVAEEENGVVQTMKNLLKVRDDQVEVLKEGPTESHMVFVPEQTTYSYYSTPVGELEISIFTNRIEKIPMNSGFELRMQYDLEMNQTFVSKCNIDVVVEV
jgi:uncharacterized beta-barrel protein YwiB (DUF1934 family)